MAFLDPKSIPPQKPRIDLAGPSGNAFVLLGYAQSLGKQLAFDEEKLSSISEEMKQKDYMHLVKTFHHYFGEHVDLILPPNWSWDEKEEEEPKVEEFSHDIEMVIVPSKKLGK